MNYYRLVLVELKHLEIIVLSWNKNIHTMNNSEINTKPRALSNKKSIRKCGSDDKLPESRVEFFSGV